MILQKTLKQIVVTVFALAYLEKAACALLVEDLESMKDYWSNRIDGMFKEIQIRKDFLARAQSFKCEEAASKGFSDGLNEGKEKLSNLLKCFLTLHRSVNHIVERTESLMSAEKSGMPGLEVTKGLRNLEGLAIMTLDMCDIVCDRIKEFDSHMLGVIRNYSKATKKNKKTHELPLFKLAEQNKPLAISMIYTLFSTEPYNPADDAENAQISILRNACKVTYGSMKSFKNYDNAIWNEVDEGKVKLLKLANKYLPILFNTYKMADKEAMDIYLGLIKENISEAYLNMYTNITPGQILKIVIMEYIMSGTLMDYRNNRFFSNLGKLIVRIGRPTKDSTEVQEDAETLGKKQNKILDALCLLHRKLKVSDMTPDDTKFYEENSIDVNDLQRVQDGIASTRWLYKLDMANPSEEELRKSKTLLKKVYFDMFYIHPILYLYQRYEDVSCSTGADLGADGLPFAERDSRRITLRMYNISKKDGGLVKAENIKNCIRAWYLKEIIFIYREKSDRSCIRILTDLTEYYMSSLNVIVIFSFPVAEWKMRNLS
ncbi:hypothetical protein NEMIN01_1002 [Nematocida minor]|uniref:uncharacterized protein n=1 Tax=Nematocida minor TaxID=1912983 RepID=UPI00221F5464|nr:uncharacterized protein NEMIN01_1002 [Nematocida minor]KAI5190378.1 hypothetical protein NEMIN01_1002 [Nematocida minor]